MTLYNVAKLLHLFSMVVWFAGLIGIFRAFVLYRDKNSDQAAAILSDMALWRYKMLATPGMVGTWVFGLAMIVLNTGIMKTGGWLHAKLLIVFLLSGFMGFVGKTVKRFANGEGALDPAKASLFNQVSLIVLLVVLALAVLRPF